jgi:peptide/nickel transport system permease protein
MPERSPDPAAPPTRDSAGERIGEDAIGALVADDVLHDITPDEATIHGVAVEAGPEIAHLRTRRKLGLGAWLAVIWLALLLVLAVAAPVLPIDDPVQDATPAERLAEPSADHWFGLDGNGRDVFSRVIWGSRNSLFIGVVAVVSGFVVGGTLGLIAGYFKGQVGGLIGATLDVLLAFPSLILALAIVTFLGRSVTNVTLGLAIVSTPVLARIARASTLSWSEREFVLAARSQGAKHRRIMWRELLPNVLPAMCSIALLGIAVVIVAEGGLAIIGAGVKPEVVTWGNVIVSGQDFLRDAPHIVLSVSAVIFLTVLALNYLGDVVRARFDVRESAL